MAVPSRDWGAKRLCEILLVLLLDCLHVLLLCALLGLSNHLLLLPLLANAGLLWGLWNSALQVFERDEHVLTVDVDLHLCRGASDRSLTLLAALLLLVVAAILAKARHVLVLGELRFTVWCHAMMSVS